MPFQVRDGLLFLNKEAHYDLGQSPLALVWKDAHISRYFLDKDAVGVVPEWQHIVLQFLDSGHVATGDVPPITVCSVPNDVLQEMQDQLRCSYTTCGWLFTCYAVLICLFFGGSTAAKDPQSCLQEWPTPAIFR